MEQKMKKTLFIGIIGISLILASCHPEHDAYIINLTREEATISCDNISQKISPNSEFAYDDLKYSNKIILEISNKRISLGQKLQSINKSYHEYAATIVGEPHHLLIQISKDGFVYLGYRTVKDARSGLFKKQPEGFPLKWNCEVVPLAER